MQLSERLRGNVKYTTLAVHFCDWHGPNFGTLGCDNVC
jgi:hypothetical protein